LSAIDVDGRRIAYDDSGGDGMPVVLLHGFPLDRTVWDDVMHAFAGARTIRVDLRGCGESEPSEGPALMESLAGDVAGLLDALRVERAAFAGHSIGGYVALAFFRMYAERVAGLALVASHVSGDASRYPSGDPAQRELAAGRDTLADQLEDSRTMDAAVASYLPKYFAPRVYAERSDLVERARAMMLRQNAAGCAQLVRGMKERLDSHDLLPDLAVPALIVAGVEDVYLKPDTLRATATAIRDAEFVALDGVGHLPMWEAPEATAGALTRFAERAAG